MLKKRRKGLCSRKEEMDCDREKKKRIVLKKRRKKLCSRKEEKDRAQEKKKRIVLKKRRNKSGIRTNTFY